MAICKTCRGTNRKVQALFTMRAFFAYVLGWFLKEKKEVFQALPRPDLDDNIVVLLPTAGTINEK